MEETNKYQTQVITVKVYLRKYYYLRINGIKTFEKYRDSIAFNQQTGKMGIAKIKERKKKSLNYLRERILIFLILFTKSLKIFEGFQQYNSLQLEIIQHVNKNLDVTDYFFTLYWWLVTVFQFFRMATTGLVKMDTDIFTSQKNIILKKAAKIIMKVVEIGMNSPGCWTRNVRR